MWSDVTVNKRSFLREFSLHLTLTLNIILGVDFILKRKVAMHVARAEAQIEEVNVKTCRSEK